ncbi:hypothetical protein CCH79_00019495 [Gambusia affinis]|uniref:E3 ubiquitin-protein ligase PPP1R11 n=1 Tax=Gambusia affinis TaxID=33528 RepID=A0A315V913_GAMAF|nr:hypothetical protein CCH79_00019495 [Gambusia affinis]
MGMRSKRETEAHKLWVESTNSIDRNVGGRVGQMRDQSQGVQIQVRQVQISGSDGGSKARRSGGGLSPTVDRQEVGYTLVRAAKGMAEVPGTSSETITETVQTNTPPPPQQEGRSLTIKLRKRKTEKKVEWSSDTVDNEHLGRRSSNRDSLESHLLKVREMMTTKGAEVPTASWATAGKDTDRVLMKEPEHLQVLEGHTTINVQHQMFVKWYLDVLRLISSMSHNIPTKPGTEALFSLTKFHTGELDSGLPDQQSVRIHNTISSSITLSTGSL